MACPYDMLSTKHVCWTVFISSHVSVTIFPNHSVPLRGKSLTLALADRHLLRSMLTPSGPRRRFESTETYGSSPDSAKHRQRPRPGRPLDAVRRCSLFVFDHWPLARRKSMGQWIHHRHYHCILSSASLYLLVFSFIIDSSVVCSHFFSNSWRKQSIPTCLIVLDMTS